MPPFDPLKTLTNAIPEFYYDLIARVIPGVLTLLSATLMYKYAFPTQFDVSVWNVLLGDVSFLFVLVISYFIGVILGPFGALIRYPFWWWAKLRTPEKFKDVVRRYVKTDMKEDPFNRLEDFKRFEKKIEKELLEHYPQDKMVLVKMWAESDMCLNVLAGIFFANLAILFASMLRQDIQLWSRLQLTVVPVITVAILGANFRHRGVIRRDFAYMERLNAPKVQKGTGVAS